MQSAATSVDTVMAWAGQAARLAQDRPAKEVVEAGGRAGGGAAGVFDLASAWGLAVP